METEPSSALTPLGRSLNLRETVVEKLRTAIITGELKEGTVVSAPALGAQLGVSATPVREAMMDLAREGLVETMKNKGFRVTTVTDEELMNVTEVRLLIEPPTVARVAGHLPPAAIAELRVVADRNLLAAEQDDLQTFLVTDRDLHALILEHAGNAFLAELATSLRRRTRMYGLLALADAGVLGESAREHHQLIDLIEAGDGVGAEALARRHIAHSMDIWKTGQTPDLPAG
ncbi:GntR family transcriptional regulator [Kribbella sp. NPDC048915]|uniref:GntR family transcriptional regulator n=1 Tax=Kribbella sp. NPDC048915 TaxID=3155148 RepID=UPI0034067EAD